MVKYTTRCTGSVAASTGCLNCDRCEEEILAELPKLREGLKQAREANDHYEVGRLQQKLMVYELAVRNMD